jgi:two-component system, LuxR family, response regulator FixJ
MAQRASKTIAVIDDDEAARQSLAFLLGAEDYRVETFESAVAFLEQHSTRFTCIIVDQHMPEMTGLELVEQLRAGVRRIPVMLLSGALTEGDLIRADQLQVEKVLEKPTDQSKVLAFVASAMS